MKSGDCLSASSPVSATSQFVARVTIPQQLTYADVLVVEPATPVGAVHAQAMCIVNPSLPIICASITAPPPELTELGVVFAASLVKPFTLEQLGAAIEEALLGRQRAPWQSAPSVPA